MAASWALLAMLAAGVGVDAQATAETRAGRAPVAPGQPSQGAVIYALEPFVGLEIGEREDRLRLQYGPRLSWVTARKPDARKPYIMHLGEASLSWQARPSVAVNLRGRASTGDTDYTALSEIVGPTQSELPRVTGLQTYAGRLELGWAPASAWQSETYVETTFRAPIFAGGGSTPPPPATPPDPGDPTTFENPFPRHLSVEGGEAVNHRVTRRDTLLLRVGAGWDSLSTGLQMLNVSPTIGWQRALSSSDSFRASGGVTVAKQFAAPAGRPFDDGISPLADLALASRLHNGRDLVVSSLLTGAVTWYLDPVLAISGPRGGVGAEVTFRFPPRWSVSPSGFFTTSLRKDRAPGTPVPDETLVTFNLPVRYQMSRNLDLEFGVSLSDRGPHLEVDDFRFHQFEFWGYAMLTGRIGRERAAPRAAVRASTIAALPSAGSVPEPPPPGGPPAGADTAAAGLRPARDGYVAGGGGGVSAAGRAGSASAGERVGGAATRPGGPVNAPVYAPVTQAVSAPVSGPASAGTTGAGGAAGSGATGTGGRGGTGAAGDRPGRSGADEAARPPAAPAPTPLPGTTTTPGAPPLPPLAPSPTPRQPPPPLTPPPGSGTRP